MLCKVIVSVRAFPSIQRGAVSARSPKILHLIEVTYVRLECPTYATP